MSTIVSQRVLPIKGGNLVATLVTLTAASDSVTLPRMRGTSNQVVQLIRPGDSSVTVSQSGVSGEEHTVVNLTGTVGNQVLLVSNHGDPIPNPTGAGA